MITLVHFAISLLGSSFKTGGVTRLAKSAFLFARFGVGGSCTPCIFRRCGTELKTYKDWTIILPNNVKELKMRIKGVHHIAINVADMKQSLKFYQDILDMKSLFDPQEGSGSDLEKAVKLPGAKLLFAMLQCGEDCVELIQYLNPLGRPYDRRNCDTGNTHLAFRVADIDEAYIELKAKGVKFNGPPVKIGAGPLKGRAFTYFTDPDGVTLEIFQE